MLNQIKSYIANEFDEKPIVVGHSLGGTLALDLEQRKSTFSKIILVDVLPCISCLIMPGVPIETIQYDSPYNKQLLTMDEVQFENMQQQMAANLCKQTEKQQLIKNWMVQADRKTYAYGYTDLLKIDLREDIKSIKIPVLILAAVPFSQEQTQGIVESQFEKLTNKDIRYIEDSRHFIMFDQLDWLVQQIKSFI